MNENIAKAFVKAQTAFGPALKTSANPFFKSKYADLSVVIEAVIDALHANDIALIQNCHESESGVIVETVFLHSSGETISCGKLSVPAAKNDPQGYGSALTYARRYSLMAACGVAPEDDDGNAASNGNVKPKGTITPTSGAGEGLTDKKKTWVERIANQVQFKLDAKDEFAAYEEMQDAGFDADEKVFFWTFFNSGQRSTLKSIHDSLQPQKVN